MENYKIRDTQISASSQWNTYHGPANGRLNFLGVGEQISGSWSASVNDVSQWLQVDFLHNATVTEIGTQGRHDKYQYVASYRVSYSNDGVNFQFYQQNGQTTVGR